MGELLNWVTGYRVAANGRIFPPAASHKESWKNVFYLG